MIMRLFARAVVKYRWAVIGLWVIIGTLAVIQAQHTPERLDLRGGSTRETEAVRADRLLQSRFSRSIGEFFAITLEAPSPVDRPGPAAVLDSLIAVLRREPYVRSILSLPHARRLPLPQRRRPHHLHPRRPQRAGSGGRRVRAAGPRRRSSGRSRHFPTPGTTG